MIKWNYENNTRAMPWKGEKDPYKIWLSEIILQQTRVAQGLSYYQKFIKNYPTVQKLANSDEKKIFKDWEGLGYYTRCRNLIAAAKYIAAKGHGIFPQTYPEILALPGVGPYTAAAIASFAYNLPYAVVDGNVIRVFARIFGVNAIADTTEGKKYFFELAQKLLDKQNPGTYNQALMDFGAVICKPVNPLCENCIFNKHCYAFIHHAVSQFPVKGKKPAIKKRFFYYLIIRYQDTIAIHERMEKDIWFQLHDFPLIETHFPESIDTIITIATEKGWILKNAEIISISEKYIQKLTHQTIEAFFVYINAAIKPSLLENINWVKLDTLSKYAFPKIITTYFSDMQFKNNIRNTNTKN